MARRRATMSSGTEKRVLGDLAYRELLGRALPLLSDDDRRVIELIKSGCTADEMGELMNPAHEGGSDAHIARAQQELVRACRTVAATASLLEQGSSCPEFASHANWWRRLLERRALLLAEFTEASKDYRRFDLDIDTRLHYFRLDTLLWSTVNFLERKKEAKNAYDAARNEVGKLPDLDQKMNEIALHATGHAASCDICQQEVSRILGQDWSLF
jgi:hypothetical protein